MKTDIRTQMNAENPDKVLADIEAKQSIRNYKEDHRPPRDGWCDGEYMCMCFRCKTGFIGDKRAVLCADCAYG